MSIAAPWFILMMWETWIGGIKPRDGTDPHWPEPYRYILGSVAMGFAALVAQFDARIGGLLAWGLLLGAIVSNYQGQNTLAGNIASGAASGAVAGTQKGGKRQ